MVRLRESWASVNETHKALELEVLSAGGGVVVRVRLHAEALPWSQLRWEGYTRSDRPPSSASRLASRASRACVSGEGEGVAHLGHSTVGDEQIQQARAAEESVRRGTPVPPSGE